MLNAKTGNLSSLLPTLEEVETSSRRRVRSLDDKSLALEYAELQQNLKRILENSKTHPVVFKKNFIKEAASTISKVGEKISCCKSGCNYCCNIGTLIEEAEAVVIAKHLKLNAATVLQSGKAGVDPKPNIKKYMGVPCPMLNEQGRCSIYSIRPNACKLNFNVSDYPQLCDTKQSAMDVPYMNNTKFWKVLSVHNPEMKIADIRDFFPKVKFGKII